MDKKVHKRTFFFLWVLCIVGAWCVLPYINFLGAPQERKGIAFLTFTLGNAILFGVAVLCSFFILRKTDLSPLRRERFLKKSVFPGLIAGLAVGAILILLNRTIFRDSILANIRISDWKALLASFYGGINEEILNRLFLFTLIYLSFQKIFKFKIKTGTPYLWLTNGIVALVFGLVHLPMAFSQITPSSFEVFRILFLNGIGAIVFGWLYWSRSLWAAMIAHFIADVMIILPSL